ncbi:LamG domain-containing protein [Streptomyces sp. NPDC002402]
MTRRWSLIAAIVGLAVALTFVIIDIGSGTDSGRKKNAAAAGAARPTPQTALYGVGWWPAHETSGRVAADAAGRHDATLIGGANFIGGTPGGGAVLLDGNTGSVDTGGQIIDTATGDYSVAARVRMDNKGFRSAVSLDGDKASAFFLQYSGTDKRFAFSFANARAVASTAGDPELGHWYHLTGTYTQADSTLRIYVNGVASGSVQAKNPERPTGHLVIGRAKFNNRPVDFWSGAISDVHAYDRALSPGEIVSLAAHEPKRG